MKKIIFLLLVFSVQFGYAQSKTELKKEIISLKEIIEQYKSELEIKEAQLDAIKKEFLQVKESNQKIESLFNEIPSAVSSNSVTEENSTRTISQCKAITASGSQCSRNADEGSDYCWQHKKSTSTQYKSSSSSQYNSSLSSRTIQTGPRGGKYYINKNGNKTYIKRK